MAVTVTPRFRLMAAALVVPALAGCGANFGAATDQVYIAGRGVNDRSGSVDVLNVVVVSAEEGTGTVVATLVNNDADDDQLLGVTVDGEQAEVEPEEIAANGYLDLGEEGAVIASHEGIVAGDFVEVAFTFENGEAITVEAPVVPHYGDYAEVPIEGSSGEAPEPTEEPETEEESGH